MRNTIQIFTMALTLLTFAPSAIHASCLKVSDLRIETLSDVARYEDVCEAKNVTIFADDTDRVILPNLKSAGLINIDSRGLRAVAFPVLRTVRDLYVQGTGLELAEFPALETVSGRFVILGQPFKFLNLPSLAQIDRLIIKGCANLEFIFADKLQSIGSSDLTTNTRLNPHVVSVFANITLLTPEQYAERQAQAEKMRLYRQQLILNSAQPAPMRPTGHPTRYRDYMTGYYAYYPSYYHDYWLSLSPWGFWIWYKL